MASMILDQLDTFGPVRCDPVDYDQAAAYTRRLTTGHYENFTVVSWLLPRRLREDFRNVYAFCRCADDLGDETGDPARSLELLAWWRTEIDRCYDGRPRHPVFVALHRTIDRHQIPRRPFDDLVTAFERDQTATRYPTWGRVLDYCRYSADPVGRLVLYLLGYSDPERQALSDATCTALQLANFWQDVRRDILERDRVYIPRDVADNHGLDIEAMVQGVKNADPATPMDAIREPFKKTIRELVDRTWPLYDKGRELWPVVDPEVRVDIQLFSRGGESILRLIERQGYDTLNRRPALSKTAKAGLMLRAAAGKLLTRRGPQQRAKDVPHA